MLSNLRLWGEANRQHYLRLVAENRWEAEVRGLAYSLMTNHVHFVAIAGRRVHGRYAQYLSVRRHRIGHLWQNRTGTTRARYQRRGGG